VVSSTDLEVALRTGVLSVKNKRDLKYRSILFVFIFEKCDVNL
jgi:hypothetical protein